MFVSDCSKEICSDEDKDVYTFPAKSADMSWQEALKSYELPKHVLHCITTESLFQTYLTYPELRMMWSRDPLQKGFDFIRESFNGVDELLNRGDAYPIIVDRYKQLNMNRDWNSFSDLDNGYYLVNIVNYEVILTQFDLLKSLVREQKAELFELVLKNQKIKFELIAFHGGVGMQTTLAILARIMYSDKYPPFMEEYNKNELLRIETTDLDLPDPNTVQKITDLSEEYLKTFKN